MCIKNKINKNKKNLINTNIKSINIQIKNKNKFIIMNYNNIKSITHI